MDQMADLVQKLSSDLRSGLRPAYDNLMGFFHAIDWKVLLLPYSSALLSFYLFLFAYEKLVEEKCEEEKKTSWWFDIVV